MDPNVSVMIAHSADALRAAEHGAAGPTTRTESDLSTAWLQSQVFDHARETAKFTLV
ncbi:MAG TPA: hypothetical protein VFK05_30100 [Polyangiaceae bacterium]|nr:hypothetical protein [Polyangiaceae bacterium]